MHNKSNFCQAAGRLAPTLLAGAVLALASGCATIPDLGARAALKPVAGYASSTVLAATTPAAAWPSDDWWSGYGDPQLTALIGEALAGAPSLAAAQARLAQAEGVAQQRGAALRPDVSANASFDYSKQSYNNGMPPEFVPKGYQMTPRVPLDFSYELDFWGRNHAALAAATSQLDAARADAAQARITLATSVASGYAELRRLFSQRDTNQASLKVRMESSLLFQERAANGLETQSAVQGLVARRAMAEADLLATDEAIALQRNKLASLLGAGPDRGLAITRPAIDLAQPFGLPEQLPANLLGRRPDVIAARLRAEAAAAQIKVAHAQFYPNVNLGATLGFQSLRMSMLTRNGSDMGSIGPAISLPIFNGGRLQGQYRTATASYDEAVANYNGAVNQALQDVADVATSERALAGRLAKVSEAAQAAREAYRIVDNRYKGGLATYLDVLSAQDTLLANLQELTTLQSRMFMLDVAMVRALGGGYRGAGL
jgi:NodT family efflux transporter outer membrane factor (OMF) lipoprotein